MAAVSCMLILFLSFPFLKFISLGGAQNVICDDDHGNYTANSTYSANLNTLLSTISSNTQIQYGFYNFSYGQNSDTVYAIGLCRGDQQPQECRSCLNNSRVDLTERCPNQKKAILWSSSCMLRYSNHTIFHQMETSPGYYMWNQANATDANQFNEVLGNLMKSLRDTAASGDSRRKYDTAENETGLNFQTVYGLVQCTPDLSQQECNQCLDGAISEIPKCCNGKIGGRVLKPSCNIRFETNSFYGNTTTLDPDPEAPPPSTNTTSSQDPAMKAQLDWEKRYKIIRVKSDVFSFGVLILEIVSGQKNSGIYNGENMEDLSSFAWRNWKEGKAINIVDPALNSNSRNEMLRCIHIGLLCVQENLVDRPTMTNIMLMLNSYSLSLPIPTEPAFYMNSRTRSLPEMQSWEYNSRETGSSEPILKSAQESENEASITELYPR
ncbi:hypothetical protein VNO80_16846 [Phaseolus coccineus]|uniref:Gnk2-homologous domain-containing protein n=1 Tax=Phaseolus coccineus TaxID=3886 RepID=A0AAN9MN76_PHACN